MRTIGLIIFVILSLPDLGCTKRYPAKKPPGPPAPAKVPVLNVRSLGTPSALILPPGETGPTDKLPFDFPLNKGYSIDGGWRGPSQVKGTTGFERVADFAVRKADNVDVDPKEVAETLEKWIATSGVQSTQSSGAGSLVRSIDYGTAQTLGRITYTIQPDAPAKEVKFHFEVNEAPRR
jgi:hypothetical protein